MPNAFATDPTRATAYATCNTTLVSADRRSTLRYITTLDYLVGFVNTRCLRCLYPAAADPFKPSPPAPAPWPITWLTCAGPHGTRVRPSGLRPTLDLALVGCAIPGLPPLHYHPYPLFAFGQLFACVFYPTNTLPGQTADGLGSLVATYRAFGLIPHGLPVLPPVVHVMPTVVRALLTRDSCPRTAPFHIVVPHWFTQFPSSVP